MWRPRDREHFYGSYDPEHEMPDPDRNRGDRWQSDAYRHNARDTRFMYRMDPDRFEGRFEGRRDIDDEARIRWNRDARDREFARDYGRDYGRGSYEGGGYSSDGSNYGGDRYARGAYDPYRERDRYFDSGPHYDRDRAYGSDRGYDRDWRNDWRRR